MVAHPHRLNYDELAELQDHFLRNRNMGSQSLLHFVIWPLLLCGAPILFASVYLSFWARTPMEFFGVLNFPLGTLILLVAIVANTFYLHEGKRWRVQLNNEGVVQTISPLSSRWFHFWWLTWRRQIVLLVPTSDVVDVAYIQAMIEEGRRKYLAHKAKTD